MAANMRALIRTLREVQKGFTVPSNRQLIRPLSAVAYVEVKEESSKKNRDLLEAYHKKRIDDEEVQRKQGLAHVDCFEEIYEKEMAKKVIEYKETEIVKGVWTENSRRAGTVGMKIGMSLLWRKDGRPMRATLIQMKDCQVLDSRIGKNEGGNNHHTEVIVGGFNTDDLHKLSEGDFGQYVKYGIPPKKKLRGFPVTKDALLPSGTPLTAAHFVPGQYLMISSISKKHGFQGVMKRWGMKGQPRTHGQTKTHRKMGASGGGGTPGRVFPGKRMPGHMGGNKVTMPSVKLLRINMQYNVLFVSGQIPGEIGDYIKMQDSLSWKQKFPTPPPFPTYIPDPEAVLPEDMYADEILPYSGESFSYQGDSA